jgi:hypothetical protein
MFSLTKYYTKIVSFDLWMNKNAYDIFALVVILLGFN